MRIGANNWGCESSVASSKYVASFATDTNGKITVKAKAIGADVDGNVLTLVPANSSGAALTYAPGTAIQQWLCGAPGDGATIPSKYLWQLPRRLIERTQTVSRVAGASTVAA